MIFRQENRSFDLYPGALPGLRRFAGRRETCKDSISDPEMGIAR
ncbi:hypothetical protein [Paraburkholderia sacchari]|nr:hypothetical protein [Paraburkholderia sacchari]